jgi:hypothetical protein
MWAILRCPEQVLSLAIFAAIRCAATRLVVDGDDGHIKFASRIPFVLMWKDAKVPARLFLNFLTGFSLAFYLTVHGTAFSNGRYHLTSMFQMRP